SGNPSLDRLGEPGTVAVVTGQQVGLFSGPAYTIYKALTAARLAEQLTSEGTPAVPVFWLATEDHDIAEVNHNYVFDAANQPVKLSVGVQGAPEFSVGGLRIAEPPVDELARVFASFPYGDEISQIVREAYRPGASFGESFQALLDRLLRKFGVLF